jgi:2-amino-4-hydroxy-6-hydroxymethyldihydropteridine diphosphokinase
MILVALGANLAGPAGEPAAQLAAALDAIDAEIGRVRACSRFYDSPAWNPEAGPDASQPRYVNAVAAIETALDPASLLAALLALEARLGRTRGTPDAPRNAARAIDLDLVDYDGLVRESPAPVLPHPRMHARGFVLQPLAEVAPGWRHPVSGTTVEELIAALPRDALARALARGWARGGRTDRV